MAFIQTNYQSFVLKRRVSLNVILPTDNIRSEDNRWYGYQNGPDHKYKTLYLLHGLYGDGMDWVINSRINSYATEHNLAVVIPSAENSFYVDLPLSNHNFDSYIGEEIVEVSRRMFPLSRKREDTFIAGLSMGGFGALRIGMKYADTFSHIAAFSSAIHIFTCAPGEPGYETLCREDECFGSWKEAAQSDKNPVVALRNLQERVKAGECEYPKLYMSCGTEDSLLRANRDFRDKAAEAGLDLTYVEEPGEHEWGFWDRHVRNIIENWLPVEKGV